MKFRHWLTGQVQGRQRHPLRGVERLPIEDGAWERRNAHIIYRGIEPVRAVARKRRRVAGGAPHASPAPHGTGSDV